MDFSIDSFDKVVPVYDGKHFLTRFIRFGNLYYGELNNNGRIKFNLYFPLKLEGKAYEFFENGVHENWVDFRSALEKKFVEQKPISILMSELLEIKQEFNESVHDFADRIVGLQNNLNRVSKNITINNVGAVKHFALYHEQTALRAFQDGLKEPLRFLIRARNYRLFEKAVEGALEEEIHTGRINKCQKRGHLGTQLLQSEKLTNLEGKVSKETDKLVEFAEKIENIGPIISVNSVIEKDSKNSYEEIYIEKVNEMNIEVIEKFESILENVENCEKCEVIEVPKVSEKVFEVEYELIKEENCEKKIIKDDIVFSERVDKNKNDRILMKDKMINRLVEMIYSAKIRDHFEVNKFEPKDLREFEFPGTYERIMEVIMGFELSKKNKYLKKNRMRYRHRVC